MEQRGRRRRRWESLEGDQFIEEVVLVDQSPIGRTPRSNPVTYIKAFDAIRELFASLPEAKKRGFGAGHFSFNIPGGRCETCQGDGTVTVEMQFLADVELICEECKGTRYKPTVLEVRYRGKNIHEVLNLTVKEALKFFAEAPKITEKLRSLEEVGLGYLRLGQSATTLSGGEAQRMKLAAHLQPASRESGRGRRAGEKLKRRLLYIFDEPTTGLHFDDVSKLLAAFRRLIDAGGSIVVIEHNLEVIKTADWVIDLGPEGGSRGGKIVGAGPPEAIAKLAGSYTGKYLARILNGNGSIAFQWALVDWRSPLLAGVRCRRIRERAGCGHRLASAQTRFAIRRPALRLPVLITRSTAQVRPSHDSCRGSRPPPELTKAEELIQKQDYAAAEPLLHKVVKSDPANYVAWFDLGFVENGLGKMDDSIAAYRKSVAAKPDVFESNLNLGLQLAKSRPAGCGAVSAGRDPTQADQPCRGRTGAGVALSGACAGSDEAGRSHCGVPAGRRIAAEGSRASSGRRTAAGKTRTSSPMRSRSTSRRWRWIRLRRCGDGTGEYLHARAALSRKPKRSCAKLVAAHPDQAAARHPTGAGAGGRGQERRCDCRTAGRREAGSGGSFRCSAISPICTSTGKKYDQAEAAYRALLAAQSRTMPSCTGAWARPASSRRSLPTRRRNFWRR